MNLNANRALFLAAAVCFAIALLGALGAIQGVAQPDWVDGGLLSVALGLALQIMRFPRLRLSTLPPFCFAQRVCSYFVWGLVLLVVLPLFLFFELTGLLRFTPWRTLSETGWDLDKHHPEIKRRLCGFLFGLAVHFWGRDTLKSSYAWGLALVDELDAAQMSQAIVAVLLLGIILGALVVVALVKPDNDPGDDEDQGATRAP